MHATTTEMVFSAENRDTARLLPGMLETSTLAMNRAGMYLTRLRYVDELTLVAAYNHATDWRGFGKPRHAEEPSLRSG